jgi:hypothetical protein
MRTLTINLYQFDELSTEAQAKALDLYKENEKENNSWMASHWAIDDCALFEPKHQEMASLFGEDYYDKNGGAFMFKNHRKGIHYDLYERTIGIKDALEVTNDNMFLTWLGVPEKFHDHVTFEILDGSAKSYLMTYLHGTGEKFEQEEIGKLVELLSKGEDKFSALVSEILERIESSYEEYFSEENLKSYIEDKGVEFLENGELA